MTLSARFVLLLLCLIVGTRASASPATSVFSDPTDPYERHNRHAFALNEKLDQVVIKPAARVYNVVLPWPARKGISNFFNNLSLLPTIVNDVLQLDIYDTASDSWRFLINSTVGVLGFVDVGTKIGLPAHSEDLGLTLAHWGYKKSHYLVLPFFGPSTVRDATTLPVNLEVLSVYPYLQSSTWRYSLFGLNVISTRAQFLEFDGVINRASLDAYSFQRNAYLQRRAYLIRQNQKTPEVLDDLD